MRMQDTHGASRRFPPKQPPPPARIAARLWQTAHPGALAPGVVVKALAPERAAQTHQPSRPTRWPARAAAAARQLELELELEQMLALQAHRK